ncbi:glycosyltransferase family 2 protein [Candidatus Saccharibacteria bacterium]|nr:glycosyltransferase family 2 protein [Candidatus Saccharibacteria bacterium]MCB9834944.1 glycosyltransferase family 2 protein [Candidatus Nomurabacteria bacterium]
MLSRLFGSRRVTLNPDAMPTDSNILFISKRQRLLEIFIGTISIQILLVFLLIGIFNPLVYAFIIIGYDIYWLLKSINISIITIRGYRNLKASHKTDWSAKLETLDSMTGPNYRQLYHLIIIPTYNEPIEVLRDSMLAISKVDYDPKKLIIVIAAEQRAGQEFIDNAKIIQTEFSEYFNRLLLIEHQQDLPGEIPGKGANITYAGQKLKSILVDQKGLDPAKIIVTTLDADHQPDRQYFSELTYKYLTTDNRSHYSFQPIPLFFNNIWEVPAPIRIVATGNSFWVLIESMRPHRLRNFAAHSQSLDALIKTDFWCKISPVEDGRHYWRSLLAFDGDYHVKPIYSPIYQDAVQAETLPKTVKAQIGQLRRWAWGITDMIYLVQEFPKNSKISRPAKLVHLTRLIDGHISWATASIIIFFSAWIPIFFSRSFSDLAVIYNLPDIASSILLLANLAIFTTIWISLLIVPSPIGRLKPWRYFGLIIQWALLPVVALCIFSYAALSAQLQLAAGKYLGFNVTKKLPKKYSRTD